jgi:hypothetical protein
MSRVKEHLNSPQFPGDDPPTAEDMAKPGLSLVKISSGWVAAGQPRWKAYTIYVFSIAGGIVLALPGPGSFEAFTVVGVALAALGVFGTAETIRGKRFPRLR